MLSIRHRLLLLQCVTVLATTIFLGALSYSLFIPALFSLQKQQLQNLARESSKDISDYLGGLVQTLETLDLEEFHNKYGDLPLEELFVRHFDSLMDSFPLISYLDKDGSEIIRLVNSRPSEYFFELKDTQIIQDALAAPNQVQIRLSRSVPGYDHPSLQLAINKVGYFGDEFLGTLLITIPVAELLSHLKAIPRNGKDCSLSLVDQHQILLNETAGPLFLRLDGPVPEQSTRHQFLDKDMFVASEPIALTPWRVVSAMPYAIFTKELGNLKLLAALTCVLVTLLSMGLATRLVRHLTRNIALLIEHAEKVGSGDYDHYVELYQDRDFEKLGEALNLMTKDLSRHRNAQESLLQIQESIIDPLVIADQKGRIKQINHATLELLGCEEGQLIGRPLADLFPDPPKLLTEASFASALLRKRVNNLETSVEGANGKRIAVLFSSSPVPGRNIDMGVVGIMKNIDELVNARIAREHALREAEDAHRRIDALLKSVADGLVFTDLSGRVLLHNQPAEELLGDPQQANFKKLLAALPEPTSSISLPPFDMSITSDTDFRLRTIQVHSSPVLDHRGSQTGIVSVLRDVTRERALEQIKAEFINTAANELTSPLTSIVGYSELLLDREMEDNFSAEQKRDFMKEIFNRSESLSKLVDGLLTISRLESGQVIPLHQQPTIMQPLLQKICSSFSAQHDEHQFTVDLAQENERLALIDTIKIQQVLEKLLSNAVKFSPPASTISISSEFELNFYKIQITDQGCGMSEQQLERLFDKFHSSSSRSGLGLGMSIVKQIITCHKGSIQVESKPDTGTSIILRLPLADR